MSYSLKITLNAKKSFDRNLDYLKEEWGAKVTNEFINRVEVVFNTISENPYLYPFHFTSKQVRRCVIHKRIIMFYRISSQNKISILFFGILIKTRIS